MAWSPTTTAALEAAAPTSPAFGAEAVVKEATSQSAAAAKSTLLSEISHTRRAPPCWLASAEGPVGLDPFCYSQFDDLTYAGTRISGISKEHFLQKVNDLIANKSSPILMYEGYAPFCRHIFVENFPLALPGVMRIDSANEHILRSGYVQRRPEELAVLTRWFPAAKVSHLRKPAKYLDLILYSREQLAKEAAAMQGQEAARQQKQHEIDTALPRWSIISVKAQDEDFELPMAPITMMRNALIEEGGSGVSIDRKAYGASILYWQQHAVIMDKDSSLPTKAEIDAATAQARGAPATDAALLE